MSRRVSVALILLGSLVILCLAFFAFPARSASAQCKGPTECSNCHEIQGQKSVNNVGAWHTDHNLFLPCNACHNGAAEATDKNEAHTGIVTSLQSMGKECKACHSTDLEKRLSMYAQGKNIDIKAVITAANKGADITTTLSGFLGQSPAQVGGTAPQPVEKKTFKAATPPKPVNTAGNIILAGLLVLGLVGGGGYITWNERRIARARGVRPSAWIIQQIRKENWSPYAAGILLGVTCILTVLLAHRKLGASTAIASIASTLFSQAAPAVAGQSMYFKFLFPPGFNWEIALLIGVFFGGMFGALSSGTFKIRWNDDPTWVKIFGTQRWKRFAIGFIGAVILQVGAGIAGGCTSGLAISGGMLLAPSAFVFMAGMFITGILVALLVYRRRY